MSVEATVQPTIVHHCYLLLARRMPSSAVVQNLETVLVLMTSDVKELQVLATGTCCPWCWYSNAPFISFLLELSVTISVPIHIGECHDSLGAMVWSVDNVTQNPVLH